MNNIGEVRFGRGVHDSSGYEKDDRPRGDFYRDFSGGIHSFGLQVGHAIGNTLG